MQSNHDAFERMSRRAKAYSLGATLYVPATRDDLLEVCSGKYAQLRSAIVCLEDSVSECSVDEAFANLKCLAKTLQLNEQTKACESVPKLFFRPRNYALAKQILNQCASSVFTGFVVPKFRLSELRHWSELANAHDMYWMPTLEDASVFDPAYLVELAAALERESSALLTVRIGGNDLYSCLGLRRQTGSSLYEGPLHYVVSAIVSQFASRGLPLSAPVFELLNDERALRAELDQDVTFGFCSKTAIHPCQITCIHQAFRVSKEDYQAASEIIASEQAVFKLNGAMAEPATHTNWAKNTLLRAQLYGVSDSRWEDASTAITGSSDRDALHVV